MRAKAARVSHNSEGMGQGKTAASPDALRLADLLRGLEAKSAAARADLQISGISYDSRKINAGMLFVAIRGEKTDGNKFVADAIARGAVAIASALPRPAGLPPEFSWIEIPDARKGLAVIAANFFQRPAERLRLIGITGTNGKTTTSYLVDSILRAAGKRVGLFGTIAHRVVQESLPADRTTPESLDLQSFLAGVVHAGGTHVVLEASSHALAMERLWGCPFAVAIFTNLTRDHFDYHKDFEEYFSAKRRLFEGLGTPPPETGVINADDPYGKRLAGLASKTLTYSLENEADVCARKLSVSLLGIEFTAETPAGRIDIRSQLVGRFNVYNLLAAVGAGVALDLPREIIASGIAQLPSVPGRFERVDQGQPYLVIVDYAHTDDALRNLLTAARALNASGRIITLFGCGGERDRHKRPLMGEAAGRLSDIVVLTSDNPRSEDPLLIINDAIVGVQRTQARFLVEPDRERAIELALDQARPGDIVVVAGKGHETVQVLRDRTIPFNDLEMVRRRLRERGYGE